MIHKKLINIMPHKKDFSPNEENNNQAPLPENIQEQSDLTTNEPQRQKLTLMLLGSREMVKSGIHHFHLTGEADASDWSPIMRCPHNPEEFMSILVRYITVE